MGTSTSDRDAGRAGLLPLLRSTYAGPEAPSFDIAVSHALLLRVAAGEMAGLTRLYRPRPTLAFGRLDQTCPGFAAAASAAAERGFSPVLRLAGGRAAAYHSRSLVLELICANDRPNIDRSYRLVSELLCSALGDVGAAVSIGELEGEYCSGRFSLNLGGRVKVAGIAQRAVRGGSLVSAAVIVNDSGSVAAALAKVYRHLGLDFDPRTTGAIENGVPGIRCADVERALIARLAPAEEIPSGWIDETSVGIASRLLSRHAVGLSAGISAPGGRRPHNEDRRGLSDPQ